MKKGVLRNVLIGVGIIFGLALILGMGVLFVFGDRVSDVAWDKDDEDVVSSVAEVRLEIEGGAVEDLGGDSDGDGGGSSGDVGFVCSEWQPVQYSLGNFFENIECLVYGVDGCERVRAVCGSELFNLDYDLGGVFEIRHSLFSGDDEIEFEIIEENVGTRERAVLRTEIMLDGLFDVGSLECVVNTERVPQLCVAS